RSRHYYAADVALASPARLTGVLWMIRALAFGLLLALRLVLGPHVLGRLVHLGLPLLQLGVEVLLGRGGLFPSGPAAALAVAGCAAAAVKWAAPGSAQTASERPTLVW